jgi:hypothetical protein
LVVLVTFTPVLATLFLVGVYLRADLTHFLPLDPDINDQVYNWHQILTFSKHGLNGGYYVVNEIPAAISAVHFSAAGPMFPIIYGTIAQITGWHYTTGLYINLFLLTFGTWIFLRMTRFDRVQILLTGLVIVFVTPILIYVPAIMQESFHQAAALILAGVFYRLFFRDRTPSLAFLLAVGVFFVFLSLTRFSWVFLLLPFLFLSGGKGSTRRLLASMFITVVVTIAVLFVFQKISAPGNNSIFGRLGALSSSPAEAVSNLLGLIHFNIRETFVPAGKPFSLTSETIFNIEVVVFTGIAYIGCLMRKRRRTPEGAAWTYSWEMPFHFYNLGVLIVAALTFYLPSGYPRVFTPPVLIFLLMLVAFKRYRIVAAFLLVGLLSVGAFLNSYRQDRAIQFEQDTVPAQVEILKTTFSPYLVYDVDADNPWCNTLLIPVRLIDMPVMAVPDGIGISFFRGDGPVFPLKSHYLWLDESEYEAMQDQLHVEALTDIPGATLYRNLDSGC